MFRVVVAVYVDTSFTREDNDMKQNFNPEVDLIEIYNNLNREGRERLIDFAEFLRWNNKYKKNVIVVDFGSNNDQIKKRLK